MIRSHRPRTTAMSRDPSRETRNRRTSSPDDPRHLEPVGPPAGYAHDHRAATRPFWTSHRRLALSQAGRSSPPPLSTVIGGVGARRGHRTTRPGRPPATLRSSRLTANGGSRGAGCRTEPPLAVRSVTAPETSRPAAHGVGQGRGLRARRVVGVELRGRGPGSASSLRSVTARSATVSVNTVIEGSWRRVQASCASICWVVCGLNGPGSGPLRLTAATFRVDRDRQPHRQTGREEGPLHPAEGRPGAAQERRDQGRRELRPLRDVNRLRHQDPAARVEVVERGALGGVLEV